jgi:hypothetical protein
MKWTDVGRLGALLLAGLLACRCSGTGIPSLSVTQVAAEAAADSIRATGGRTFIGFKESGQIRGVDEQGHVLTTSQTIRRMKDYLREQGISIETEFDLIPAVAARLPLTGDVAGLVLRLRMNPNIDYVEPILSGTRF